MPFKYSTYLDILDSFRTKNPTRMIGIGEFFFENHNPIIPLFIQLLFNYCAICALAFLWRL